MYVEVSISSPCDLVIDVKFNSVVLGEEWKQWQGPVLKEHTSCAPWAVRKPQLSDAALGKKEKSDKRVWKISNEEVVASFQKKGKLLCELYMDISSEL